MSHSKNYYEVLGISRKASFEEIRKAYRHLAKKNHPDLFETQVYSDDSFKALSEAYHVLSDSTLRLLYDQFGSKYEQVLKSRSYMDNSCFSSKEEEAVACKQNNVYSYPQKKGSNIQVTAEITFEEAYTGTVRSFLINNQHIDIHIPSGVEHAQKLFLKGKGSNSPNGGENGDLFLLVYILKEENLSRKGQDLYYTLPIDIYTAILGGYIDIKIPQGTASVYVPMLTDSDQTILLKGKGMPAFGNDNKCGDLHVRIKLQLPKRISNTEIDILKTVSMINKKESSNLR
jgi:curved DNA-binding protein